MRIEGMALAELITISKDNKPIIINMFDTLETTDTQFDVFCRFSGGKPWSSARVLIKMRDATKKVGFSEWATIQFGDNGKHNLIIHINLENPPNVGTAQITVEDKKHARLTTFEFEIKKPVN